MTTRPSLRRTKRASALIATLTLAISSLGSQPALAAAARSAVVCGGTTIASHATGKYYAPENTVAGINYSADVLHAGMVEMDVRFTKSNYPYLLHDDTLDRTTNGTGAIADKWVSDMGSLSAADYAPWNTTMKDGVPLYAGMLANGHARTEVPWVADWLMAIKTKGVVGLLDMKVTPTKAQADNMMSYVNRADINVSDQLIYMGEPASVMAMRSWYPGLKYAVIEYPPTGRVYTPQYLASIGVSMYAVPYNTAAFDKGFVDYYHEAGLQVMAWTSDSESNDVNSSWQKVYAAGADLLVTNEPAKALAACTVTG